MKVLITFTVAWVSGIFLADFFPTQPLWQWLILAVLGGIFAAFLYKDRQLRLVAILLLGFALGGLRHSWHIPHYDAPTFLGHYTDLQNAEGQPVEIVLEAKVVVEPEERDNYIALRVAPTVLLIDNQLQEITRGQVLIRAAKNEGIEFADTIRIAGYLVTPSSSEDFDYAAFLYRQGVYAQIQGASAQLVQNASRWDGKPAQEIQNCQTESPRPSWLSLAPCAFELAQRYLLNYKQGLLRTQKWLFPEPESAYLRAVTLGSRADLPKNINRAFEVTGTSHMISISGYHISVIAAILLWFCKGLLGNREKLARILAVLAIAVYVLLVGAPSAAVRSALMGGLVILMGGFHQRTNGLMALSIAVFVMTLFWSDYLWQLSFQLSVLATLGLILFSAPIAQWLTSQAKRLLGDKWGLIFGQTVFSPMAVTLSAMLATLPLAMLVFGRISLIAPLANLIINPAQPPLLLGGFLVTVLGNYWRTGGEWLAWVVWIFLRFTLQAVQALAKIPHILLYTGRGSWLWVIIYYLALMGVYRMTQTPVEKQPSWWQKLSEYAWAGLVALVAVGFVVGMLVVRQKPDGKLHVHFLNVGQGDATLLQTPDGEFVLVNGGSSGNRLANQLGTTLPFGTRKLSWVILTNPTSEGLVGLSGVLGRYEVENVLVAFDTTALAFPASASYADLANEWEVAGTPVQFAVNGQVLTLGDVSLYLLQPQGLQDSAKATAVEVRYGDSAFLLAAPLSAAEVRAALLQRQFSQVTVLQAPGFAASDAFDATLWQTTRPLVSVVSVGAGNRLGAPALELERILRQSTLLRTDRNGWVEFVSDGKQLWTTVERE
ncbi:MAG TPA: ComEC/Rec2 family competence protein [Anaerolineales bacterium]|nr:ComEC/Rec2 family competence protein [Anaerolineales bacterium]